MLSPGLARKENDMCSNANEEYAGYAADEIHTLTEENKKLKAQIKDLERAIEDRRHEKDMWYKNGMIEGLKFAIRCNGVSGNEV